MTRRKKGKPVASKNSPCDLNAPATTPRIAAKVTPTIVSRGNTSRSVQPSPPCQIIRSPSTATLTSPCSSSASSITRAIASTSSMDEASINPQRKKKPVNVKVTYVTEQIHIYPKHPVLNVERLSNLDYHISKLTESIGRRPRVYQHGKGVRFISESNEEYRIIQRYLGKIESAEKIAWCSYTVPTGNCLKVNETVRKVEFLKVAENIQKLNLENGTNDSVAKQNESLPKDVKTFAIKSSIQNVKLTSKGEKPKEVQLPTRRYWPRKVNLTLIDFLPKDFSSSISNQGQNQNSTTNKRLNEEKKKPSNITQARSYQKNK